MRGPIRHILLCLLAVVAATGMARAAEEILSFDARIAIDGQGTIEVVEEIAVNVEGRDIRRGIFRDIPLRFEDENGRLREVGMDVMSVTRNGAAEPYALERGSGMIRIRIGDADVLLPHGEHVYEIAYRTDRQIRFFDDHDEFYWNVTGNGWDFPIRSASADVRLPGDASAKDIAYFTGALGSTETAARAERLEGGNRVRVTANRVLGTREGLTIAIAMPKGSVARPSAAQLREWWLRDNAGMLAGGIGLLIVLAYYLWAWSRVGRDPPSGVIVPRWDAPEGVSPALANYIDKKGFFGQGWDAFSAAMINLAVKGLVELDDLAGDLTILRTAAPDPGNLPVGEAAILAQLEPEGSSLTVDKANGERVQRLGRAFRTAIEREHSRKFYRHNIGYVVAGIALSVLVIVLAIWAGAPDDDTIGAIIAISLPAVVLSIFAIVLGRSFKGARSLTARIFAVVMMAFVGFVTLSVLAGMVVLFLESTLDLGLPLAIAGILMTNLVFLMLMGAPTPIGRRMMDGLAGLRHYLSLAEKDRMNMQGAPQMSPRHFETLLPYAVALGVEKPWSRAFEAWLAAAAATGAAAAYSGPAWYHGRGLNAGSIGRSMGGLASSMSSSFTASLPAPKSSSSGFSGGGSSGGGGGGGGGGGW